MSAMARDRFWTFFAMFAASWVIATLIHARLDNCEDAMVMGWISGMIVTFGAGALIWLVPHHEHHSRRKTDLFELRDERNDERDDDGTN